MKDTYADFTRIWRNLLVKTAEVNDLQQQPTKMYCNFSGSLDIVEPNTTGYTTKSD